MTSGPPTVDKFPDDGTISVLMASFETLSDACLTNTVVSNPPPSALVHEYVHLNYELDY